MQVKIDFRGDSIRGSRVVSAFCDLAVSDRGLLTPAALCHSADVREDFPAKGWLIHWERMADSILLHAENLREDRLGGAMLRLVGV